jgi:hypothetical protein
MKSGSRRKMAELMKSMKENIQLNMQSLKKEKYEAK